MEKYNPLKMGEYKSSYCLSSKDNENVEGVVEFNVVLTNNIFKNKNIIQGLKDSKINLESNLMRKKEEYKSILININTLIDTGMASQDEKKIDEIIRLVGDLKNKKLFIQRTIDEINKEIINIDLKITKTEEEKNYIIKKYNLDSKGKCRSIVCNKEDEEELKDTLEGFGCIVD